MDYRIRKNRREAFIRWYAWSLNYGDCDPAVWATNYLNKRYSHNDEERFWLAWLYGTTYHLPSAWVIKNEFPDFELVDPIRITGWNKENYPRLRYQTDTKWNKGHLPVMFLSYKAFIGDATQRERLEQYYGDNESQNFDNLWKVIKGSLHKFGRYSTWFYLQHLRHTCGLAILPTSLMLCDFSGSRSHRNGLHLALGEDDKCDVALTSMEYDGLEAQAQAILKEMIERFPDLNSQIDLFTMETCLCSFKKIFRVHHGRYLGYYLDRQAEEIRKSEGDGWHGIDWDVMWDARSETIGSLAPRTATIMKNKFTSFMDSGKISGLEFMFTNETPTERLGALYE